MAIINYTDQIKYAGRGYLDAKMMPVETVDDLKKIPATQRFEGLTIVVLNDGAPQDYWLVGGISNSCWVPKTATNFDDLKLVLEEGFLKLTNGDVQLGDAVDLNSFFPEVDANDLHIETINYATQDENNQTGIFMCFTYSDGTKKYLDMSQFLANTYEAGSGIVIENNVISLDAAINGRIEILETTIEGIKVELASKADITDIDEVEASLNELSNSLTAEKEAREAADAAQAAAIATVATDATNKANDAQNAAQTYADTLNTAMNTRVEALEAIDHEHVNKAVLDGITADKVNAWDAAEQNAKDYADGKFVTLEGFNEFEAEYEEKLNGITAGAEVNVIESVEVNGITATIDENKKASVKIEADDIELGTAISGNDGAPVYEANTKISVVLQGINDSIRAAVTGGVNSVVAGDGVINVNNGDVNNPKVSLIVEASSDATVEAGHVELIKGDNGLYGVMYYDGDDAE